MAPLPALSNGDVSARTSRLTLTGVAAMHLLVLWALLQMDGVREAVRQVTPMVVSLIAVPAQVSADVPAPLPAPLPAPATAPPRVPIPAPVLAAPEEMPAPAETSRARSSPEPVPTVATPAPPAPVALPAQPGPPPAPPPRKLLSGTAVQYLVEPPVEVPRLSRRAGEHGTVWLRVVVDVHGLPVQVMLQRSSGYPRLDEQALWAMRQARFKPHTQDGRPVEVEVAAPIEYPLQ